jgi:glycosidase
LKLFSTIFISLLALLAWMFDWQTARAEDLSQIRARTSPAWLRDGVIYEIFPRSFSPAGNLDGVTAGLDQLKDLGVTILWIMPIHPIGEKLRKGELGSPYSIKDYYAVDPHYGNLEDFKRLVREAHRRHLKVIMDLVANHTAWDNSMTEHPEFYKRDKQGKIISPNPDWNDVAGLNYDNPQLRQYMLSMMTYWVQTCDVDGFRCDAAEMVPTDFWNAARAQLDKVKPDIILLAEASKPELLVNAFDVDYSWPLMHALYDVMSKGEPPSKLRASWEQSQRQNPRGSLHMRISDDHDEARVVARFGAQGALAASALMFTLDGVPMLYNGMEVGDTAETSGGALFEKRPIDWLRTDGAPTRQIYRSLIEFRKQHIAFRNERVVWLHNSNEKSVVSLKRSDATSEFVVVINFSKNPNSAEVEIANGQEFNPVEISGLAPVSNHDFPLVHLAGYECRIYQRVLASEARGSGSVAP